MGDTRAESRKTLAKQLPLSHLETCDASNRAISLSLIASYQNRAVQSSAHTLSSSQFPNIHIKYWEGEIESSSLCGEQI